MLTATSRATAPRAVTPTRPRPVVVAGAVLARAVVISVSTLPGAANLEVLHNVGHSPMIEAPVALAERIIDFITDDFDDFDNVRSLAD